VVDYDCLLHAVSVNRAPNHLCDLVLVTGPQAPTVGSPAVFLKASALEPLWNAME
jgi:hypothetical protein